MKQCPFCKKTYADETLKFCLDDGNLLTVADDGEPPTVLFGERHPMQIDIPQNSAPKTLQMTATQPEKKSAFPLIAFAVIGFLLLVAIGIGAVLLIKPFDNANETAVISNNSANSKTNTNAAATDQNKELQDKLANLERQLQEQKNQKKNVPAQTFPSPPTAPTSNNSGTVNATVRPSSDGFLSLRTEPNVKTGTQLVKIPTGATVKLENCEKNYITIDGRRGRWCMVSYGSETGWAFDAWLDY